MVPTVITIIHYIMYNASSECFYFFLLRPREKSYSDAGRFAVTTTEAEHRKIGAQNPDPAAYIVPNFIVSRPRESLIGRIKLILKRRAS